MNIDLFDTVFMVGWLVYLFGFLLPHRKQNRQNSVLVVKEDHIGYLVMVLDFLGMQVLPLIYFATSAFHIYDFTLPLWAGIAGVIFLVFSLCIIWKAHHDLGENWSAKMEVFTQHVLVTNGIYRSIRHPLYAGLWLWGISQALLLQNWIAGFSSLILFCPVFFYRIVHEENMMLDIFGEEYRAYMQQSGRIFPRIK